MLAMQRFHVRFPEEVNEVSSVPRDVGGLLARAKDGTITSSEVAAIAVAGEILREHSDCEVLERLAALSMDSDNWTAGHRIGAATQ